MHILIAPRGTCREFSGPAQMCAAIGGVVWDAPIPCATTTAQARPGFAENIDASEFLDQPAVLREKIRVLAGMIRRSHECLVYTGAGISTAAGVPDYASKAATSLAPHLQGATAETAKSKRAIGVGSRLAATPTRGHHVLAALAHKGHVKHWLQQNHDRLAQKAGFPQAQLNEIHGAWGDRKNRVLMMDEQLRPDMIEWMLQRAAMTDLCIAMGTSLCGMTADSAAVMCAEKHRRGAGEGLVIINLQRTPLDDQASLRIWGLLDEVHLLHSRGLGHASTARAPTRI